MPPTVIGLEKLGANLQMLSQEIQKNIVRKAAYAGAGVFVKGMRRRAPVRVEVGVTGFRKTGKGKEARQPGHLKRHIRRAGKPTPDGGFAVPSGPDRSAWYGRLVELGFTHQTGPRSSWVQGSRGQRLRAASGGGKHVAGQPFMRPTFDQDKAEAERVFGETTKSELATAGFKL